MKIKNFYLVLNNSTSMEYDKLPIDMVRSIKPVKDIKGIEHLMINYYNDEFCINETLFCDSIDSVEEIKL